MSIFFEPFDVPATHLKHFWGSSGDFWQLKWDSFLNIAGKIKIQ